MIAVWDLPIIGCTSSFAFSIPDYPVSVMESLYIVQRLPSEPIGSTTVTFLGVNTNSEIRVYLPDTTEIAGVENCSANQQLTWDVYAAGSANNTVTIKIINVNYELQEFNFVSTLGAVPLNIIQVPDVWYSNPA